MAPNSKERILRSAANLFRTQGYHATGLNQVLSEGGAPKGSMYFHFPGGKEQLGAEAIAMSGTEMEAKFDEVLSQAPTPGDGVARIIEMLGVGMVESGFTAGCPIATTALDAGGTSEPIRQACDDAFVGWQRQLATHLSAHGTPDADTVSTIVLAAVEGALLLARTRHDLAPLNAVAAHLRTKLDG
ncbi:MAG: TetR/AcrR family transcriptional regulator [Aeromicrobium sp.]